MACVWSAFTAQYSSKQEWHILVDNCSFSMVQGLTPDPRLAAALATTRLPLSSKYSSIKIAACLKKREAFVSIDDRRSCAFHLAELSSNVPSLSLLPSVTLSLEAKLQMLHTYMTVTWLPLPCEVEIEAPPHKRTHSESCLFICSMKLCFQGST